MAASGSNSSANSRTGVRCNCGGAAVIKTIKQGPNYGRKFYGCPNWPVTDCKFMKYVDEVAEIRNEMEELRFKMFEKDVTITEMELFRDMNEEKIKSLELKNRFVEEENKQLKEELSQMRVELMRVSTTSNHYSIALLICIVVFGFMELFRK